MHWKSMPQKSAKEERTIYFFDLYYLYLLRSIVITCSDQSLFTCRNPSLLLLRSSSGSSDTFLQMIANPTTTDCFSARESRNANEVKSSKHEQSRYVG
jgi:hypothetical protein